MTEKKNNSINGSFVFSIVTLVVILFSLFFVIYVREESPSKNGDKPKTDVYVYDVLDRDGNATGLANRDGEALLKIIRKNADIMSFPVMVKGDKIGSISVGKKIDTGVYELTDQGDLYVVENHVVFNSTEIRDDSNYHAIIKGKDAERVKKIFGVSE